MREMARQWHCTPGTVSRAYAQLAQEGLTSGRRGGGTRVASSSFGSDHPTWQWAGLVNRAERFLLEAINSGYTPAQAESALSVAVSRWQDLQRQSISPTPSTANDPTGVTKLRFAGSHDLAVEILARMLGEEMPGARLSIDYVGSLGGLMALARGEADIAGIHLWDETSDEYTVPFIRRLLPGSKVVRIALAHRSRVQR